MKLPSDYVRRVYGGLYGKIIGIRHGSLVEGWPAARIAETYGEVERYLFSFKNFAADDDSNGPLFFVRALEDYVCSEEITPQQMAETFLNYAPCEHGFLWWGGYGNSTEHTAYLNLIHGIRAPRSGSAAQNGPVVAEQIGGQIFNDVWGLISPGDCRQAAGFARKMASVTHDGNGVYGAMFVAACVSAAFTTDDIRLILRRALAEIPPDCTYRRMAEDLTAFYDSHPENWRDCLSYVQANYGYDRYPGNCHIIPNAAVIVLSLLYGRGDFSRSINICNMCGWDTDCNVGNVGMILGVMAGIEGIRKDWLLPIGDFLACSSVLGAMNLRDIANDALWLASLGARLAGEAPPFPTGPAVPKYFFCLPESTHSFRAEGAEVCWENLPEEGTFGGRCLRVRVPEGSGKVRLYRQAYYQPRDFNDDRYSPAFTPEVFPGQEIRIRVRAARPVKLRPYVLDLYGKERIYGEEAEVEDWTLLRLRLPSSSGCIAQAGIEAEGGCELFIDYLTWQGKADYTLDFSRAGEEFWTVFHREPGQCSHSKGIWEVLDGQVFGSCADHGELFTGSRELSDCQVTALFSPELGDCHLACLRVQGNLRSYMAGFLGGRAVILKNTPEGTRELASAPWTWAQGKLCSLAFSARGDLLELLLDGTPVLSARDQQAPYLTGCTGFSVRRGSRCRLLSLRIQEL